MTAKKPAAVDETDAEASDIAEPEAVTTVGDPHVGHYHAIGAEIVSFVDGEYTVDPATGEILARL